MQKIYKMYRIYKNTIATMALAVGLLVLGSAQPATAQRSLELTVSPPITYLKAAPGMMQTHIISIKNNGAAAVTVTPSIVDFSLHEVTGAPVLQEDHSFPYFTMPASVLKPIEMEPGQVAQLQLKIEPPMTAPDREYPLSVVFTTENLGTRGNEATQISGAVASNLIILVSDKNILEKKLVVADFGLPGVIDSFRGVTAQPVLKNERFSAGAASGSAKLTSWTGRPVAEYQIYPDNVLGFNSRKIRATELDSEPPTVTNFTFRPAFMLGPYKFSITLDNDGELTTYTHTIFAIPFSIFVAALMGAIVGGVYWFKIAQNNRIKL